MTASKQPVKNVEDMKRLDELCEFIKINWVTWTFFHYDHEKFSRNITVFFVKEYCPGHKGVYGNEEADKLATGAVVKYVKKWSLFIWLKKYIYLLKSTCNNLYILALVIISIQVIFII